MALLFVDSFDHYTTRLQIRQKWSLWQLDGGNTVDIDIGTGRFGTNALKVNDFAAFNTPDENGPHLFVDEQTTIVVGIAANFPTLTTASSVFQFWDNTALQCYLRVNTDLTLSVVNGDKSTILGTSGSALIADEYHYIECKVTIGGSGSFEVRVDEVLFVAASGVDTQTSGNNKLNFVQLGGIGGTNNDVFFDDFYVCDTNGAQNNDFLGDTHIEARFPDNSGDFSDFGLVDTGFANTENYQSVDEETPDDDVTYNVGSALNQRDTFYFGSPTLDVPVYGVVLQARIRKRSAGERNLQIIHYESGTASPGDAFYFGSNYRYHQQIYEVNLIQAGSVWDRAAIGTAQFGYQIIPAP
jgi:hypothetical protein